MVCTHHLLDACYDVLAYWVMHLVGLPLPEPDIPLLLVVILFPVFFMTAMGEEMGWLGYAIDPMQDRWGALKASIIMGAVWGHGIFGGIFKPTMGQNG
jgi:uncharacterized protein